MKSSNFKFVVASAALVLLIAVGFVAQAVTPDRFGNPGREIYICNFGLVDTLTSNVCVWDAPQALTIESIQLYCAVVTGDPTIQVYTDIAVDVVYVAAVDMGVGGMDVADDVVFATLVTTTVLDEAQIDVAIVTDADDLVRDCTLTMVTYRR